MVSALTFYVADHKTAVVTTTEMKIFENDEGLPFPLNLSRYSQIFLTTVMLAAFVAVNFLIWIDQLNGLFLGIVIILKVVMINYPVPLSQEFGQTFCEWIDSPGCIYIVGATIWTTFIAFYRIIFIKAQNWLKSRVGEKTFLRLVLAVGFFLQLNCGFLVAALDDNSVLGKMCLHYSGVELEILRSHQDFASQWFLDADTRNVVLLVISVIGIGLNVIEMICYVIFFHYISQHNNTIASTILSQSVIKQRNKSNAISMLGLFASLILEIWYILFVGLLSTKYEISFVREVLAALKDFDFLLIPIVQILTSPPIKKFLFSKSS